MQRIQDNCEILKTVFHLLLRCVWLSIQHLKLWFRPRPLHCFFRQGTLLHFVSPHPGVQICTGNILLGGRRGGGVGKRSCPGGVAILLSMLHAKETEISSRHLGLWLAWAFTFFFTFHPRAYLLPVLANQEKTVLNNVI